MEKEDEHVIYSVSHEMKKVENFAGSGLKIIKKGDNATLGLRIPTLVQRMSIRAIADGQSLILSSPEGTGKKVLCCVSMVQPFKLDMEKNLPRCIVIVEDIKIAGQLKEMICHLSDYDSTDIFTADTEVKGYYLSPTDEKIVIGTVKQINSWLTHSRINISEVERLIIYGGDMVWKGENWRLMVNVIERFGKLTQFVALGRSHHSVVTNLYINQFCTEMPVVFSSKKTKANEVEVRKIQETSSRKVLVVTNSPDLAELLFLYTYEDQPTPPRLLNFGSEMSRLFSVEMRDVKSLMLEQWQFPRKFVLIDLGRPDVMAFLTELAESVQSPCTCVLVTSVSNEELVLTNILKILQKCVPRISISVVPRLPWSILEAIPFEVGAIASYSVMALWREPQEFVQCGETEFLTELADSANVNHIVVFMTGSQVFPSNLGGAVYIRWASSSQEAPRNWHFLGGINNQKPSAIFKIAQLNISAARHEGVFTSGTLLGSVQPTLGTAEIGIMVDSIENIEAKIAAEHTTANQQSILAEFDENMMRNLVNHAETYKVRLPRPDGNGPTS